MKILLTLSTLLNFNLAISMYLFDTAPDDFHVGYFETTTILPNFTHVDKSLLIDEIIKHPGPVILITRPRKWGKSWNLDMIEKFLDIEVDENGTVLTDDRLQNRMLFVGGTRIGGRGSNDTSITWPPLKITNVTDAMEHLGRHPVIFLRLGGLKAAHYYDLANKLKSRIGRLFRGKCRFVERYATEWQKEILAKYYEDDYDDISAKEMNASLDMLSELLYKHFNKKVYILIDDYDDPINRAFQKSGFRADEFDKVVGLFRRMFHRLFEQNPYLEKGIVTGKLALAKLFSKRGCKIKTYTLVDDDELFSRFFGFTESEVGELVAKMSAEKSTIDIKNWCGGYGQRGGLELYHPWSVLQCVRNKCDIGTHWKYGDDDELVVPLPCDIIPRRELLKLIQGDYVTISVRKEIDYDKVCCAEGVYSLYVSNGYLAPVSSKWRGDTVAFNLSIPNQEVKCVFLRSLQDCGEISIDGIWFRDISQN